MIAHDPAYISHGEIQTGLAQDFEQWAVDLAGLYEADFLALGEGEELLAAHDSSGALRGIAILAWAETPRRRFAVIEDMVVDPACRSAGLGAAMLAEIEAKIRAHGRDWVFLESGIRNQAAHRFFERQGFRRVSEVFAKRLAE